MNEVVSADFSESEFNENNSDSYRPLAYISYIQEIHPIEGADAIVRAVIENRDVVVKKGEFKVGEKCVYIEPETILPELPCFEFMRVRNFKLRIAKLRGIYSEGLALPIDEVLSRTDLNDYTTSAYGEINNYLPGDLDIIGHDLTAKLGVVKIPEKVFTAHGPGANFGKPKGNFPVFLKKTDEVNLYNMKPDKFLAEIRGRIIQGREKLDGSSGTYYSKDGEFGFCSRNLELKSEYGGAFWEVAEKYNLPEKLPALCVELNRNLCVQGEVCGPGIQGNKYDLKEKELFVHNIYDIDDRRDLDSDELEEISAKLGLKVCPLVYEFVIEDQTYDDFLTKAEIKSKVNPNVLAEGIVWRTKQESRVSMRYENDTRVSYKTISRLWKAKYNK